MILAASVEENDGDFELEEVVLHIRTTEGRLYLSGLVEGESKERYFFALLAKKGDVEWVLWPPELDIFKAAVQAELEGDIAEGRYMTIVDVPGNGLSDFARSAEPISGMKKVRL